MGAGQFDAGVGPAGDGPVAPGRPPRRFRAAAAMLFDVTTRDYPLDDEGFPQGLHPVDQRVRHLLAIRRGSLAAQPDVGNGVPDMPYVDPATIQVEVERLIRAALQVLLEANDIEILEIEVTTPNPNNIRVRVAYENLRLPSTITEGRQRTETIDFVSEA